MGNRETGNGFADMVFFTVAENSLPDGISEEIYPGILLTGDNAKTHVRKSVVLDEEYYFFLAAAFFAGSFFAGFLAAAFFAAAIGKSTSYRKGLYFLLI